MRLDQILVERGLCASREQAKRLILAGKVRINGHPAHKASDSVKAADELTVEAPEKFVSRGGHKLEHALVHFQTKVTGLTCFDLGASTGGFSDCLLQYGAEKVFAVAGSHEIFRPVRVMSLAAVRTISAHAVFSALPTRPMR